MPLHNECRLIFWKIERTARRPKTPQIQAQHQTQEVYNCTTHIYIYTWEGSRHPSNLIILLLILFNVVIQFTVYLGYNCHTLYTISTALSYTTSLFGNLSDSRSGNLSLPRFLGQATQAWISTCFQQNGQDCLTSASKHRTSKLQKHTGRIAHFATYIHTFMM